MDPIKAPPLILNKIMFNWCKFISGLLIDKGAFRR